MKLKIISVKDKAGNEKTKFMEELRQNHPSMSGEGAYSPSVQVHGSFFLFWDDQSGKYLATSAVEDFIQEDGKIVVETRNSVYEFKILGE